MVEPEFGLVKHELQQALSKLETTTDPESRKHLLREIRLLLSDADRLLKLMVERPLAS